MMVNGVLGVAMVVSGKLLQEINWPFFRLMAVSSAMIVLCIAAGIFRASLPLPSLDQAKWLVFRGMFGAATFLLQISAVRIGASPGDAAALASINTILAALFGRAFLGEQLKWVHGIAVLCSASGAVFISKPSVLFGGSETDISTRWLGFLVAAASGMTQAFVFISARKSSKSSLMFLNASPAFFCVLAFTCVPLTPFVNDSSWDPVVRSPGMAVGIVAAFFLIQFGAMTTNSAASTWCPAAISATVNTGSKMVSSYVAQAILFDKAPDLISLFGASLMLCAVLIMAVARLPGRQPASSDIVKPAAEQAEVSGRGGTDDEDNESLASFIAAEFVECKAHDKPTRLTAPVRRAGIQEPAPHQIGAVLSAIVANG